MKVRIGIGLGQSPVTTVDPEHFGMSIGYAATEPSDAQLAALAARTKGRDVDPRDLLPVGPAELRALLTAFVDAGISKFVLRPTAEPASWSDELAGLAEAVGDLQT